MSEHQTGTAALDVKLFHLIATVIDACEQQPSPGPGHLPNETIRVVATLRRFLREGTPWRSLTATPDRPAADPAPLPQVLGRGEFAGEGSYVAGCYAARPPRPDPRHLLGTGQARGRSDRPQM